MCTSSAACGGVLIASTLKRPLVATLAPWVVPLDDDEVAGADIALRVAQPDGAGAFDHVLDLVAARVVVLGRVARLDRDGSAGRGVQRLRAQRAAGARRAELLVGDLEQVDDARRGRGVRGAGRRHETRAEHAEDEGGGKRCGE